MTLDLDVEVKEVKDNKEFPFDVFSGDLLFIAEDFDETPECFKEYQ